LKKHSILQNVFFIFQKFQKKKNPQQILSAVEFFAILNRKLDDSKKSPPELISKHFFIIPEDFFPKKMNSI